MFPFQDLIFVFLLKGYRKNYLKTILFPLTQSLNQ